MADLAYIHNLADLNLWAAGSPAQARFTWTYNDTDGQSSSKYRLRIYRASSGGSTVYDSGEVTSVVASGATMTHDATYGLALGDGPIFANIIQNGSSTDANNYTTASVNMKAGRLYLLAVENSKGSATADAVSSVTGGAGVPTFTSRSTVTYNTNLNRVSIWSAVPTADYSGTLTINFGGVTQTGAIWVLDEARGIDTTTNHGVVQQATGTGNSTTPLATLSAFASTANPTYGAQGHAAATASTAGSGFGELADQTQATPAQALQTESRIDSDTTVDATITSAQWGMCALELTTAERWWTVEVWDSVGESSGESSRLAFKVLWGQGLYEYNTGAGSSAWSFSSGSVAANTQAAFLFRGATSAGGDAATGKTAWYSSIGSVPLSGLTYLQVLVRMATQNSTTQPALPDMTFNYLGGASIPDRWTLTPGAEWALDESVRRYGSRAIKCSVASGTAGDRTAYPYRITTGDDVPVTPNTTYTWSVFVRTNGALTGGSLRLEVWSAGGGALIANSASVTDTVNEPDKWQRLSVTVTTGGGDTFVRPMLRYTRTSGVNESFWMDAMSQEEGTVATTWRPGGIGKAVVVDVQGIVIDGVAGGIFRVRTGGGTQIEAGTAGLVVAANAASDDVWASRVIGDSQARFVLEANGLQGWGAGSGAVDVVLDRSAANTLRLATGDRLTHEPVGCSVFRSTTQSITNGTWTAAIYNEADLSDPFGMHDPSTNNTRITIPTGMGGAYRVTASAAFAPSATGSRFAGLSFNAGGAAEVNTAGGWALTSHVIRCTVAGGVYEMAAGDYVELLLWQDSGGNLLVNYSTLYVHYLGEIA